MSTESKIVIKCNEIRDLLIEKNRSYGDAALQPLNIFSPHDAENGIRQRIDDKLKRIHNVGLCDSTEDTLIDLAGYIVLLMISRDDKQNNNIQGHKGHQRAKSYYTEPSAKKDKGG